MYKTVNKWNQTFLMRSHPPHWDWICVLKLRVMDRHGNCARVVAAARLEAAHTAGVRSLFFWGRGQLRRVESKQERRPNMWRVTLSAALEWWRDGQRSQRDVNVPSSSSSHVSWRATNRRSRCMTPPTVFEMFRVRMSACGLPDLITFLMFLLCFTPSINVRFVLDN